MHVKHASQEMNHSDRQGKVGEIARVCKFLKTNQKQQDQKVPIKMLALK